MSMLQDAISSEDHGYGVKNINKRIKLNYGEQYGITYKSVVGEEILVEVRIAAIRVND